MPLSERVLNTESAPKNLIESHAKLYSKYVNTVQHVGAKQPEVCRVEVTLKPDEEHPECSSNVTGKFNAISEGNKEPLKTESAQVFTDEDISRYLILNDNSCSHLKDA